MPLRVVRSNLREGLNTSSPRFLRRLAAAMWSCFGLVLTQYQAWSVSDMSSAPPDMMPEDMASTAELPFMANSGTTCCIESVSITTIASGFEKNPTHHGVFGLLPILLILAQVIVPKIYDAVP